MKESIGVTHITYSVECPSCKQHTYSDLHRSIWFDLDYSDGKPNGLIECPNCKDIFKLSIGIEIR